MTIIPASKLAIVTAALRSTFGVDAPDEVRRMTAGLSSALVYRIVVAGHPYLLRLVDNPDPRWTPDAHFAAMRAGADAGIAPRVHHASVDDKVAITDFVEARPYPADVVPLIGSTLRTLHALPRIAKQVDYLGFLDGAVARTAALPLDTAELFERYREIRAAYAGDGDQVTCHNDLKHENILYDGTQLWLVDWEAVFVNNRYFDLAVAGHFFMRSDADEARYLEAYLGAPASEQQQARAYLVRVMSHVSYVTMFAVIASRAGIDLAAHSDDTVGAFRAFHDALIAGTLDPNDPLTRLHYAKAHLAQGLTLVRSPRFAVALALAR